MTPRKLLFPLTCALLIPLSALAGPVNVNTADAATISAELQGIGLAKAEAIVAYREQHGPFKTRADLTAVSADIRQPCHRT